LSGQMICLGGLLIWAWLMLLVLAGSIADWLE
jgi:hypothetical protein